MNAAAPTQSRLLVAPQPDIGLDQIPTTTPSLLVYFALTAVGQLLIGIAFALHADWPGRLINLGSSLLTTVLILIFVDQLLRRSEVNALRRIPGRLTVAWSFATSARRRQMYRFVTAQLVALDKLTPGKVTPSSLDAIATGSDSFVLLSDPGRGKTTNLQFLCLARSREYLAGQIDPLPILYPLRYWLGYISLEDAIFNHVATLHPITRRAFDSILWAHPILLVLDGIDELGLATRKRLFAEMETVRGKISSGQVIISSRAVFPSPAQDLPFVDLTPLAAEEVLEIRRRRGMAP